MKRLKGLALRLWPLLLSAAAFGLIGFGVMEVWTAGHACLVVGGLVLIDQWLEGMIDAWAGRKG